MKAMPSQKLYQAFPQKKQIGTFSIPVFSKPILYIASSVPTLFFLAFFIEFYYFLCEITEKFRIFTLFTIFFMHEPSYKCFILTHTAF